MLKVHHLNNSRSQRILWLLEELGTPYEIVHYKRDATTRLAPPELKAVHPLGKSPVVTDAGQTLAESGAILQYLLDAHDGAGTLIPPPGTPERLRFNYWLHYAEGSLMPPLLVSLIMQRIHDAPVPFFIRPIVRAIAARVRAGWLGPELARHLDFVEAELGRDGWFAGAAFSAADIQMSYPVEAAATRADLSARPNTRAWLERIHARPAYQRALARGGPAGVPG